MAIINYYEKYGFSQTDELEKIQWVINQKITDEENDSFGEGHSDKMFILQLAQEAFASAESRAKYDQDLADSQKKSDPDGERKAALEKWYKDAEAYYDTQQYDLAKTAIDRALQFATPETINSAFYDKAACIYFMLKLYTQALDFENQSIVLSPEDANGYYLKSYFLHAYIFEKNLGNEKMQDIWQQLKANCELTVSKVIAQEKGYNQASKCYEFLAEMNYVYASKSQFPITGNNNPLAEEYALKALAIINAPRPDVCPIAKKILDDISARRAKVAELEQANVNLRAKLKKDNDDLDRQVSNLRKAVSSQKSSINNATAYGSTSFGGEVWVGIIALIIGFICLVSGAGGAGIVFLIIGIAVFAIKGSMNTKNANIRNTLDSIRENEAKISNKSSQINSNKSNTDSQIRNNDNIINQQKAGLAPQPDVNIYGSAESAEFEIGYITYMFENGLPYPDKQEGVLYAPVILTAAKTISDIQEILPLLETLATQKKELLIVAEDIEGEALATLYLNNIRGTFNSIPVKSTDKSTIQEIAALTGAQVVTGDLKATTIDQLGRARLVTVSAEKLKIVTWAASPQGS